jgi:hypothetical protein
MKELKIKKKIKNRKKQLSKFKNSNKSKEENDVQIEPYNEFENKYMDKKKDGINIERKNDIKDKNSENKSLINLNNFQKAKKYYRTSSLENFNLLNFNKETTLSTGFNFNNRNNLKKPKTFYKKIDKNNINNFSSFTTSNRSKKNILTPKDFNTFSRNNSHNTFTSLVNKLNNLTSKNMMNKTFKILKYNKSDKNIIQSKSTSKADILTPKINIPKLFQRQYEFPKEISSNKKRAKLKKIKSPRKEQKMSKADLYLMRKKKVPEVYEQLKNYRNLLSVTKKNDAQKANQLFLLLYDKKNIDFINEKNSTLELYNSYCKMKESIERCHGPERIFRKYRNNISVELKDRIGKSIDQDNELKNKYYDFMQMVIKKKLGEDENKYL